MLVRGMALAVIFTWIGFAIWPLPPMKDPDPPAPPADQSAAAALTGTAIVMPLVLIYLLFGLADAIPVLLTTVLIVAKMEQSEGRPAAGPSCSAISLGASSPSLHSTC